MTHDIEIRNYGKKGDLEKAWGYYAIYPIESPNSGLCVSAEISVFDNHFVIQKDGSKLKGIESLRNIEKVDERAYNLVKEDLSTRLLASLFARGLANEKSGIKIIDTTERGKLEKEVKK